MSETYKNLKSKILSRHVVVVVDDLTVLVYIACGGTMRFTQSLKWSKEEAGALPQAEVECPLPRILCIYF